MRPAAGLSSHAPTRGRSRSCACGRGWFNPKKTARSTLRRTGPIGKKLTELGRKTRLAASSAVAATTTARSSVSAPSCTKYPARTATTSGWPKSNLRTSATASSSVPRSVSAVITLAVTTGVTSEVGCPSRTVIESGIVHVTSPILGGCATGGVGRCDGGDGLTLSGGRMGATVRSPRRTLSSRF